MTKVRFQADADFNEIIVKALLRREPTIDFQTATQLDPEGVDDLEVLKLAADAGRILVTHDRKTIPTHFPTFIKVK
jgi:predicted nuclease of predicted toxin-antitoxin system